MGIEKQGVEYQLGLKDYFSSGLKQAEMNAASFEGVIGSLQNKLAGLFIGYEGLNFAKSVVDVGAGFEAQEIGMTTFLKSTEKAHEVVERIKKEALATPFNFTPLLEGNRMLISAGIEAKQAGKDVLNLANAVSAVGRGNDELSRMLWNMQQIKQNGKATGQDIRQFGFAGINILDLVARATGKTATETSKLAITYDMVALALQKAHDAGGVFEGGMERMQVSTLVKMSNIGDAISFLKNDIFVDNKKSIDAFIMSIYDSIQWIRKHIDAIKALVVGIASATIAYKSLAIAGSVYNAFLVAQRLATVELTFAQWALNTAMAANPISLVAIGIGAAATAVYSYIQSIKDYKEAVDSQQLTVDSKKNAIHEQLELLRLQTEELKKQKHLNDADALKGAVKSQRTSLMAEYYDTKKRYEKAWFDEETKEFAEQGRKLNKIAFKLKILDDPGLPKAINEVTAAAKGGVNALKDELNEPKASKIQNITFNLNQPFQNQKISMGGGTMDVKDIAPAFTQFLMGLVQDSAIIASE